MRSKPPLSEQGVRASAQQCSWRRTIGAHFAVLLLWLAAYTAGFLNTLPGLGSLGVSLWYLPAGVTVGATIALGGSTGVAVAVAASLKSLVLGEAIIEHLHGLRHAIIFTLAGLAFRQLNGTTWPLGRLRSSAGFVGIGLLSATSSACLGVMLNAAVTGGASEAAWTALPSWIVGDAIGVLTVGPLMVLAFGQRQPGANAITSASLAGSVGLVLASNLVAFGSPALLPGAPGLWFLVIFAPIVVAVVYGAPATMIAVATTNLLFPPLAGWLTPSLDHFEQQLFLLLVSTTGLLLGGALGERDSALAALRERERSLAQELDARTLEIREASEAHVRTLASLSHDLRQPVQALSFYLEILRATALPAAAKEPVARATLLAARLRDLVQSVLGLARDEAARARINRQAFPIQAAFERFAAALTPLAEAHKLKLSFVASTLIVDSDPVMLDRILGNLIENAIHHSGGKRVLVGCRRRAGKVMVHIIDDGRGMQSAPGEQPMKAPIGSGLSLGLRIVTDTANALGHAVEILPTDHGTNIRVTIQAVDTLANAKETSPPPIPALRGNALIVEDDPEVSDALAMTLRQAGMSVATVTTHRDALSRIAELEDQPDLLILDYHLPEGRLGTETYCLVDQIIGRVIPTIFVTGSTRPSDLADLQQHEWPVLLKPVSPAQLLEAAQEILKASDKVERAV